MVIAKPEWFKRKNGGFLSSGITWQGAIYMISTTSMIFIGMILPQNIITSVIVTAVFLFLIMDANIASLKSLDERERMHYAISMRNTAWGIIIILVILMTVTFNLDITKEDFYRLIMLAALGGGIIGIITRYKLQKEN